MNYQTIKVRFQEKICYLQLNRPDAKNTINDLLIDECHKVLELCEESITVVVIEGLREVFSLGADFYGIQKKITSGQKSIQGPDALYDLWLKLANGPYITVSHVRGMANAGGVGFVAASDIVLADKTAQFSLSELLFGLMPACVLPFLIRRIGFQRAHYMTIMTKPILFDQAQEWGLVDAYDVQSESLLRKHLLRLRCLSKTGILRYKSYMRKLYGSLIQSKTFAVEANKEVFSDPRNMEGIIQYIKNGIFPWEK